MYALSQKFYVEAINTNQKDLRTIIFEAAVEDESILQIKRELLANPIKGKYADYHTEKDGLITYKG